MTGYALTKTSKVTDIVAEVKEASGGPGQGSAQAAEVQLVRLLQAGG